MIRSSKHLLLSIFHLLGVMSVFAAHTIAVDAGGRGDFKTIQAAINNIPIGQSSRTTILIKNGTYFEKLFIEKNNLVLLGESCDSTIISASIARDEWRCKYPDDWGVATINVCANDITLQNITIVNSFGFDFEHNYNNSYPSDSTGAKAIGLRSHQMALRTMQATRLKAIHCKFRSLGGDTVSPWEAGGQHKLQKLK
jgi:pectinesterase